jgi:hypothetical protein
MSHSGKKNEWNAPGFNLSEGCQASEKLWPGQPKLGVRPSMKYWSQVYSQIGDARLHTPS